MMPDEVQETAAAPVHDATRMEAHRLIGPHGMWRYGPRPGTRRYLLHLGTLPWPRAFRRLSPGWRPAPVQFDWVDDPAQLAPDRPCVCLTARFRHRLCLAGDVPSGAIVLGPLDDVTLLARATVAALLGLDVRTIRRMRDAGTLQTVMIGCSPRVPLASLRAYIARQQRQSSVR